jgi:hypothetical protein
MRKAAFKQDPVLYHVFEKIFGTYEGYVAILHDLHKFDSYIHN